MHVDELKTRFGSMTEAARFLGIHKQNFTNWKRTHNGQIPQKYLDKLNAAAPVDSPPITGDSASTDAAAPDQV